MDFSAEEYVRNFEAAQSAGRRDEPRSRENAAQFASEVVFAVKEESFFWTAVPKLINSAFRNVEIIDYFVMPFGLVKSVEEIFRFNLVRFQATLINWDEIDGLKMQDGALWMRRVGGAVDEMLGKIKRRRVAEVVEKFAAAQRAGRIPARVSLVNQQARPPARLKIWAINAAIFIVVAGFLIHRNGGFKATASSAQCSVSSAVMTPDVFVDAQGNPDAGKTMEILVINAGEAGDIKLAASLSNSEGQWKREQVVKFEAGERKTLRFAFPEPTINATNEQGAYECWPAAK